MSKRLRVTFRDLSPSQAANLVRSYGQVAPRPLSKLIPAWVEHKRRRGRCVKRDEYRLAAISEILGDPMLHEIRGAEMARVTAELLTQGLKPATVNRYMRALTAALNWALDQDWLDRVPRYHELDENNKRDRLCEPQELDDILEEARAPYREIILVAHETGARLSEVLGLDWKDVNFASGTVRVRTGKSKGRRRTVPMSDRMAQGLRGMGPQSSGALFSVRQDTVTHYWASLCESLDIKGLRFHDLRHTRATIWALSGEFSPPQFLAVMGWKSWATASRYITLTEHDMRHLGSRLGVRDEPSRKSL